MTMPKRIHQRRTKGWRMPPGAKSVARPHRWGNRYSVEEYGRDEALRLFEHVHMTPERRIASAIGWWNRRSAAAAKRRICNGRKPLAPIIGRTRPPRPRQP